MTVLLMCTPILFGGRISFLLTTLLVDQMGTASLPRMRPLLSSFPAEGPWASGRVLGSAGPPAPWLAGWALARERALHPGERQEQRQVGPGWRHSTARLHWKGRPPSSPRPWSEVLSSPGFQVPALAVLSFPCPVLYFPALRSLATLLPTAKPSSSVTFGWLPAALCRLPRDKGLSCPSHPHGDGAHQYQSLNAEQP